MEQIVSNTIVRPRFYAVVLGAFAGVAAVLAVIGIYGLLAFSVRRRAQEIGIRMALGAHRSQIVRLVLQQGMMWSLIGIGLGLAGSLATTRYLTSMLFGLSPLDVPTYAAVAVVFAIVSGVACAAPAYRATRVDPVVALRHD
jgi:ABC-type antimicrobial peptide transport system permease subunit